MTIFKGTLSAIVLVLLACASAEATGLRTTFSEVTMNGLEAGKSYSTKAVAGLPLVVENTGDAPLDLEMEVVSPSPQELKKGYEPIPDTAWVNLAPAKFPGVMPGAKVETDITISIPAGGSYSGKSYQVYIWTHSVGLSVGVGLKSKLLFSVR